MNDLQRRKTSKREKKALKYNISLIFRERLRVSLYHEQNCMCVRMLLFTHEY